MRCESSQSSVRSWGSSATPPHFAFPRTSAAVGSFGRTALPAPFAPAHAPTKQHDSEKTANVVAFISRHFCSARAAYISRRLRAIADARGDRSFHFVNGPITWYGGVDGLAEPLHARLRPR